jgi:hypothetical protein
MKLKFFTLVSLLFSGAFLSAQMSGMMTMQQNSNSRGTTLGANTTTGAAGIALGNRVVMRGYVDFIFDYQDEENGGQTESFSTSADVDFLFDFSPLTAEIHFNATNSNSISATTTRTNPDLSDPNPTYSTTGTADGVGIEQVYGRYAFNRDFNISFGRQLTALGYEADEAPGLYSVSNAYLQGSRRNYVDGVRANFNNGRFGFTLGLHDDYFGVTDNFNGDNIAIDLAASLMIVPGLEARLGYAQQEVGGLVDDDISQFNAWIAYNPGDLTLAFEYDNIDMYQDDYWSMLLLANYQFNEMFGATFKYTHEDMEDAGGSESDADRFTFALLFTITQNLFFNVEYSHAEVDAGSTDYDIDEFYLEALLTF